MHVSALALGLTVASLLGGCARPLPGRRLDPVVLAGERSPAPQGPLAYEAALAEALRVSPELRSLAHAVEGSGGWPAGAPVGSSAGADGDGRPELGASLDLLSVFGLGPWRAERVLAGLRRSEATLALGARARELAGELAEAYAVAAALAEPSPEVRFIDSEAFVKAGLTTDAATTSVQAARASLADQVAQAEAERRRAHLRVRRILGLVPDTPLDLTLPGPAWPEVPEADAARVLATDPEVQRRLGAYEVARGELLRAQAERDPGIEVDPALALDPTHFFGAVTLRLPLGAGPAIRAAHARLEAARLAVRAGVLAALEEAAAARVAWTASEQTLATSRTRLRAALALTDATRANVEAQGEGLTEALLASQGVVDALADVRAASLEAARARVRAATRAGWPAPTLAVPPAPSTSRPPH